jgi:hypothetical protein
MNGLAGSYFRKIRVDSTILVEETRRVQDFFHQEVIRGSVYKDDFRRVFGLIEGEVDVELDVRFAG